jgi:single-stranded DNA-binding protein
VSRIGALRYTPSGTPILELTLAAPQTYFDKDSIGYFEVLIRGKIAEEGARIRIGQKIELKGSLWMRSFKNRKGARVNETKIMVETIEGETNEKI